MDFGAGNRKAMLLFDLTDSTCNNINLITQTSPKQKLCHDEIFILNSFQIDLGVTLSLSPNKTEGQKKGPMNNKKRTQMDTEKKSSLNSTPVEDKADEDDKSTDSTKTSDLDYAAISEVVALLPAHLPRYVPGPLSPYEILELVLLGVDLFDSSWVTASADLGHVLVLDELTKYFPDGHEVKINNESLPGGKNGDEGTNSSNETGCTISIKDKKFVSRIVQIG